MSDPDLPKLQINPGSTAGLERWLVAIRNLSTNETQISLVQRKGLPDVSLVRPEKPADARVSSHLMLRDKDWCAVGEWIAINLWSGDPGETGQAEPIIDAGANPDISGLAINFSRDANRVDDPA